MHLVDKGSDCSGAGRGHLAVPSVWDPRAAAVSWRFPACELRGGGAGPRASPDAASEEPALLEPAGGCGEHCRRGPCEGRASRRCAAGRLPQDWRRQTPGATGIAVPGRGGAPPHVWALLLSHVRRGSGAGHGASRQEGSLQPGPEPAEGGSWRLRAVVLEGAGREGLRGDFGGGEGGESDLHFGGLWGLCPQGKLGKEREKEIAGENLR